MAAFVGVLAFGQYLPLDAVRDRVETISSGAENPYDFRVFAWREASRLFWERPMLGWGPGSFIDLSAVSPSLVWARPLAHPHSGLLTLLAEHGILGAAIAVTLASVLVVRLVRLAIFRRDGSDITNLAAGGLSALSVLAVHLSADYALRNPVIMVTVWFVIGFSIIVTNEVTSPQVEGDPNPSRRLVQDHIETFGGPGQRGDSGRGG